MPGPKQIINYLDKRGAKYAIVTHKKVYTAYDAAQTLRRKLDEIAKNLLVKTNKGFVLVLLPASKRLDLKKLKKLMNAKGKGIKKIEIPKEGVMVRIFKIKPGALGAFGSVHELEVYMDKNLQKVKKAIFPTGSFTDSVEMAMKEFEKLEKPIVGMFSEAKKFSARGGSAFGGKKKIVKVAKKAAKKAVKKIAKKVKKIIKKRT
jgi:Ala-tRNA(Pro) deacylase